jgi:lipopolysaccharide transport system permease protein
VPGYFTAVWRLRYFWMAMVRNDLRARYRRSLIGVGWSLLHPIAMTIVLCVVFAKIFQTSPSTYAPFLLAGLVTWSFVTTVVNLGCQCFFQGESYIRQHPAPLAIYPLRVVLGAGIHCLLGLAVVIALVWCVQGPQNVYVLVSLVPSLVLLFIFGWALAVCMGVMNVMFQDTQHLTEVLLQMLFYVTPILYSPELLRARHLDWFVRTNPIAAFLDLIRQPVLEGRWPDASSVAIASVSAAAAAGLAMLVLWRFERRMVFYL